MSNPARLTFDLPDMSAHRDGSYTALPRGYLAALETSLERTHRPDPAAFPLPDGTTLVQPDLADLQTFKQLYHAIGDPWLWFGRLQKSDQTMRSILTAPTTTLRYLLDASAQPIGLFEAQQQGDDTLEVSYFGLVPSATGKRIGRALLEQGLAAAWTPAIIKIWLHTCTFDSPSALPFYQKAGFKPFAYAIEIAPDPRLQGLLPRHAAPHIPLADFSNP